MKKLFQTFDVKIFLLGTFLLVLYGACSENEVIVENRESIDLVNRQDSLTLVSLYRKMDGQSWSEGYHWDLSKPVKEWNGVTLELQNDEFRVVGLWFMDTQIINGELPKEIGDLSALRLLSVTGRNLRGEIPVEIGRLKELRRLMFYETGLTGPIPKEIGNLVQLQNLTVEKNSKLTGGLPVEIGQLMELTFLNISDNPQLGGVLHPEFGNLEQVEIFYLRRNGLSGQIPKELANINKLKDLNLDGNVLTGSLPKELALTNIKYISIGSNQIEGPIPEEFGNSQVSLWASRNNLSGTIPSGLLNRYTQNHLDRYFCTQNSGYGFLNCTSKLLK